MPVYEYFCEHNQQTVEVTHSIKDVLKTWGEVCAKSGADLGKTPPSTPVERLISRVNVNFPETNSSLKAKGFTKLVRRDKGVYENVTATDKEKRYVISGDPSSAPDLKRKISD